MIRDGLCVQPPVRSRSNQTGQSRLAQSIQALHFRVVHLLRYLVALHLLVGERVEHLSELVGVVRLKPLLLLAAIEDDRHPVVNRFDGPVGVGRDNLA